MFSLQGGELGLELLHPVCRSGLSTGSRGGYGLSLIELAQLVELPLATLEQRSGSWRWRDWVVLPAGEGRWRLERDASGSEQREGGGDG